MMINCPNFESFMEVIESLVHKGILFNANAETFCIQIPGGY